MSLHPWKPMSAYPRSSARMTMTFGLSPRPAAFTVPDGRATAARVRTSANKGKRLTRDPVRSMNRPPDRETLSGAVGPFRVAVLDDGARLKLYYNERGRYRLLRSPTKEWCHAPRTLVATV